MDCYLENCLFGRVLFEEILERDYLLNLAESVVLVGLAVVRLVGAPELIKM